MFRGRSGILALLLLGSATVSLSQTIITTFAGSRWIFPPDGTPARSAPNGIITAVAADSRGNVYFADSNLRRVFRIDGDGILSTAAGNGVDGYAGDGGPAVSASLSGPAGLALDSKGNLYICDTNNFRIRKVDQNGIITTFAGNGTEGYTGDGGLATSASLSDATRIAIDSSGNVYVSDTDNHVVRRITSDGVIRTIAGNGMAESAGDGGPAIQASFQAPAGLAIDAAGNIYIADQGDSRVRVVNPAGVITTFAGTGLLGATGDGGPAIRARLAVPRAVAIGRDSSVYIADSAANRIRSVAPGGNIATFAGNGAAGLQGDGGPAGLASLYSPFDVAINSSGGLLVADYNNLRVRLISGGNISTIAGNGNFGYTGDGGVATSATLPDPRGVAIDPMGNVNICDSFANRVRTVNTFGIINLTAGTSIPGFSGDGGPATAASLTDCEGIAVDSGGNLYVADTTNQRIRKISSSGIITTFAGNGVSTFSGDGGQATAAGLSAPTGVAVDSTGNVYIADTNNNRIRRVAPAGIISTIAGNGTAGYSGDGGPAIGAAVNSPARVALDAVGNIYFSDNGNNVIRKISSGQITTVAGAGVAGFSGDGGPAAAASLNNPRGVAIDSSGDLYIADYGNHRIREVTANGTISTAIGNGTATYSGDGTNPLHAGIGFPTDVQIDPSGNIYVVDFWNARVRRVQPTPSSIVLSETGMTFRGAVDAASIASKTLRILNGGAGTLAWTVAPGTLSGGAGWLTVSPAQGTSTSQAASSLVNITVNPAGLAPGNYYGQLRISSPGVANSPRLVTIVLNVLDPSQTSGESVDPAGLVFTASGSANPDAESVILSKPTGAAVTFTTSFTYSSGTGWLSATSGAQTVSTKQSIALSVQPNIAGLAAQAYTASLTITFSDGTKRVVPIVLALTSNGSSGQGRFPARALTLLPRCTPAHFLPVVTSIGSGFTAPAGWPIALETTVLDDCGQPMTTGMVTATFSSGDPPLALTSMENGTWTGTWEPRAVATGVIVTVAANALPPSNVTGTAQISGQSTTNLEPPIVNAGGVVNGASFAAQAPVAPGMLVAIFGANLSNQIATDTAFPVPTVLNGNDTEVIVGGVSMPLLYAGPGQINAIIPFDVAANATQQVIVRNGVTLSVPEPLQLSSAAPGVFFFYGTTNAIAIGINPDGSYFIASPSAPAHPGQALVVYCTGLGAVVTTIQAGESTPLSPLPQTIDPVTATIGGIPAQVFYAGLVAGFSGLYQVNVIVPANAPAGDNVQMVLTGAGQSSPAVNIAIR